MVHILSHPSAGWRGEKGHADAGILGRHLPPPRERLQYFVCGPEGMMDVAESALDKLGVPGEHVRSERFGMVWVRRACTTAFAAFTAALVLLACLLFAFAQGG